MKKIDFNKLADDLKKNDKVDFAYIFGSSQNGVVKDGSDVDIAVYLNCKETLEVYSKLMNIIESSTGAVSDVSVLNTASSILGMEALHGKLLFYKEDKIEEYIDFYTYTCRQYEEEMFDIEQNLKYRGY